MNSRFLFISGVGVVILAIAAAAYLFFQPQLFSEIFPKYPASCDDGNKLTSDKFNYTVQKRENTATHYFFDDFENGLESFSFYNALNGQPDFSPWSLFREGGNTVLKGVNHAFADIPLKEKDYIVKFKFKRIKGSPQVNIGNNFFMPENPAHRYIIRLEDGDRLSLAEGLNEQKRIYNDLQYSPASFRPAGILWK